MRYRLKCRTWRGRQVSAPYGCCWRRQIASLGPRVGERLGKMRQPLATPSNRVGRRVHYSRVWRMSRPGLWLTALRREATQPRRIRKPKMP